MGWATQALADGADILDIGACSTRPGSSPASEEEAGPAGEEVTQPYALNGEDDVQRFSSPAEEAEWLDAEEALFSDAPDAGTAEQDCAEGCETCADEIFGGDCSADCPAADARTGADCGECPSDPGADQA